MTKKASVFGRPTKYKEEYCELLVNHMAEGFTFDSFAGLISVNIDTLYEWCKQHVNFSEAKKQGRARQLLSDEKMLKDITSGKLRNGNVTGHIFKMKNCHRWVDRFEQNINVNKESTESLIEEAKRLAQELEDASK
jgi:hypothetical protein